MRTLSQEIGKYNALMQQMTTAAYAEMDNIQKTIWNTFKQCGERNEIISFSTPQELSCAIHILMKNNQFMSISWRRKTTSKSDPSKVAGSIDTMTIRKVEDGKYIKGTTEGKRAVQDIMAGRICVWKSDGKLRNDGYGNWRTVYANDIEYVKIEGVKVNVVCE